MSATFTMRLVATAVRARRRGRIALGDESVTTWRVSPADLDLFGHMTNHRYLLFMDLARVDFLVRAGALGELLSRRWTVPIGCAYLDFHGELRPLERFEIRTRLVSWDERWFYFRQEFRRGAAVVGVGHVKAVFRGKDGNARPGEVLRALLGSEPPAPPLGPALRERFGLAAGGRDPIAIVGIGCRLPGGASDGDGLWRLLLAGRDCVVPIPESRWSAARWHDPSGKSPGRTAVNRAGLVDQDLRQFDAAFFGMPPVEAEVVDPQQRLLLETSWEALDDAGIPAPSLAGTRTGVFVGGFTVDSFILRTNPDNVARLSSHTATSSSLTMLSNRLSYAYDLRGPSMTIDTACSSSLVAAHVACRSIWDGECETALVGGVNALLQPETQIMMSRGRFLSPTGRCHAFGADADGYVRGEGAVVLVVKPLAAARRDGNPVHAVILGSAVNQDGRTPGITMPSPESQVAVMRAAYADARVDPAEVVYVEAHGTGTAAGDPIEASSIGLVVGQRQPAGEVCRVGSIKTNIGHLEAASGVAGLAKAALVARTGVVPPSLHSQPPNPSIPFGELRLEVATRVEPLPERGGRRVVGVNGFGYGGTNAHVVVAAPPAEIEEEIAAREEPFAQRPVVLPLSARSPEALDELAAHTADAIEASGEPLQRIARSAAVHRAHHRHRLAWHGEDRAALVAALRGEREGGLERVAEPPEEQRLLFVYTGMGPQWFAMGRELHAAEPVYAAAVDECDAHFRAAAGWSIAAEMARPEALSRMARTEVAQPANAVLQIALTRLWASWGVVPDAVIGHSVGEVAAAHVAGALGLADAMRLAHQRSRLQQELAGQGTMLAVGLDPEQAAARVAGREDRVSIAAINSAGSVTLAGERAALEEIAAALAAEERFARFLQVEVPYHSPLMERVQGDLASALAPLSPVPPSLPIYSTAQGGRLEGLHDAAYWWQNVRHPVLFADALGAALADGHHILLEVGPHPVLAPSIREVLRARGVRAQPVASLVRAQPEVASMCAALARLHAAGARIDWRAFAGTGRRVPLPRYPWQRKPCWSESDGSRRLRHGDSGHALLTAAAPDGAACELNLGQAAYLLDHVVGGAAIFPAAGTVELVLAAHAERTGHPAGSPTCSIEKLELLAPVPLRPDQPVRLTVAFAGDSPAFHVHARAGEAAPFVCARGELYGSSGAAHEIDLDELETSIDPAELYASLARAGLSYGPAFRAVERLEVSDGELLARVRLPAGLTTGGYHLHPVLLDAAFHSLVALVADRADGREVVPGAIDRIEIFGQAGSTALVHGLLREVGADSIRGDLTLADDVGRVFARVTGFTCRLLRRAARRTGELLHTRRWVPIDDGGEEGRAVPGAWRLLLDPAQPPSGQVVDLRWLEAPAGDDPVEAGSAAAAALQATLAAAPAGAIERYVLVTAGAEDCLARATLLGLARTAMTERPDLAITLVDLDRPPAALADLFVLLDRIGAEQEVVVRAGDLLACRLARTSTDELAAAAPPGPPPPPAAAFELRLDRAGDLESLAWIGCARPAPGPGEVEVAASLVPLNFKDAAKGLGLVSARTLADTYFGDTLGMECCGRIARVGAGVYHLVPGDRVFCLAPGAFRSHVVQRAEAMIPVPDKLAFEDLAGIVVYMTVFHALLEVARLQPGERLLVHSATGGVGLAAIEVARWIGAEVFATAGSQKKRAHLRRLGVAGVAGSRDVAFADDVMRWTDGRGVDVVLNVAAGEVMYKSFACLAPMGRFIEVGKASFDQDAALKLRPFQDNLTYAAVDLDRLTASRPHYVHDIIRRIVGHLAAGDLPPLPIAVHPPDQVSAAFRLLARGEHIGKVAVAIGDRPAPLRRRARVRPDGTYLVTGGTAGFGLECARWLVRQGARHLLLVSRRGVVDADLSPFGPDIDVRVRAADVSDQTQLARVLAEARATMPPLRGVLHAAMVLDDRPLDAIDRASLDRVMAPKARGAWNLHRLTACDPIELMLYFSSVSSLVGNANQAAYVAANSFLDTLARARRRAGLPATSIQWGVLAEVGVVARDQATARHLELLGIRGLSTDAALDALGRVLDAGAVEVGIMDVDWSRLAAQTPATGGGRRLLELAAHAPAGAPGAASAIALDLSRLDDRARRTTLEEALRDLIGRILRIDARDLSPTQPLREIGIDSILAIEITLAIEERLGVSLPTTTVTGGPPIRELAASILDQLTPAAQQTAA
jgi:acyl transferase domain-containing protein/NADPH:quinone reductase-like Zn-dependent oxidoreductase/acyl-CoA thioesterase FadM/acyl carrier protein